MSTAVSERLAWPHRFVPGSGAGAAEGPVVLALHGTGGDEHDLLELAALAAPGQPVLSPRGKVKEGPANRWFRRFAEGRFDLEDVERRAGELAGFVQAALEANGLAGRQVVALGFSNGANIAASLLLRQAGVLSGAILLRAQAVLEPMGLTAPGARVLLVSGAMDPIVPRAEADRLAASLGAAGAAVDHRVLPAGHGLIQADVELARAYFAG